MYTIKFICLCVYNLISINFDKNKRKFDEAPSLKPKKLPQKEKQKKNILGANKIYVKKFKLIGEINKFNPTHRKSKHANFRTSFA